MIERFKYRSDVSSLKEFNDYKGRKIYYYDLRNEQDVYVKYASGLHFECDSEMAMIIYAVPRDIGETDIQEDDLRKIRNIDWNSVFGYLEYDTNIWQDVRAVILTKKMNEGQSW